MKKIISLLILCTIIITTISSVHATTKKSYVLNKIEVLENTFNFLNVRVLNGGYSETKLNKYTGILIESNKHQLDVENSIVEIKINNKLFTKKLIEGQNEFQLNFKNTIGSTNILFIITKTTTEIIPSPSPIISVDPISSTETSPINTETPSPSNIVTTNSPEEIISSPNNTETPNKDELPKTGEEEPINFYWIGGVLCFLSLAFLGKKLYTSKK